MKLERIVAGEIFDKKANFRFRVLAFRKMSKAEVEHHFWDWYHHHRDKRKKLKNQTIDLVTNFGMQGGFY